MYKNIISILVLLFIITSCGSGKRVGRIATKDAEAANVIKKHYKSEVDFKTLSGKLKTIYQDEEKTQTVNLTFRMEKDKAIWMSAQIVGFPVAKAYITPTKVSYYEKFSKSFFEGDFSLLSSMLGTPLDFEKLQNLLIGQTIYDLRDETYAISQSSQGYQFMPVDEGQIKKMFLLDPVNYKASAQQLAQVDENRSVTVTYSKYQEISGKLFPKEIKIIASEAGKSTNIELVYRSLVFNEDVSFPFEIPSGYDEISVK